MIIQIGTEADESRILWKHKESDEWERADIDDLIDAYENRPNGEWIPVSERLPNKYDQYLCYCEDGCYYVYWLENKPWAEETVEKEGITAWKPIPAPYKGE